MFRYIMCSILCLALLTTAAYAAREYEVDLTGNEIITVRLDSDGVTGHWNFDISDESVIDIVAGGYDPDIDDDYIGPVQFVVSFKATSEKDGSGFITFKYITPPGRVLDEVILRAYTQDGEIFLDSADSFSVDGNALCVRLNANATTGFQWSYDIDGDVLFNLISEDYIPEVTDRVGAGGVYEAVFAPGKDAGHADVIFNYSRPWEDMIPARTVTVGVDIDKDGGLEFGEIEFRDN